MLQYEISYLVKYIISQSVGSSCVEKIEFVTLSELIDDVFYYLIMYMLWLSGKNFELLWFKLLFYHFMLT